ARNLVGGRTPWGEGGRFFTGFGISPLELEGARVELLETFDSDGSSRPCPPYEPDRQEMGLILKLHEEGRLDRVWVSPKVPFMVLLLGGMFVSLGVGDLLVFLLSLMLSVM
ncbi:MAG: A24 family peptidase C-terminal domain-containing protein, partial [Methermicoccaceae archaeon]